MNFSNRRGGMPKAKTPEEVDRRIELWHVQTEEEPLMKFGVSLDLHEYLGWTWDEYVNWIMTGEIP